MTPDRLFLCTSCNHTESRSSHCLRPPSCCGERMTELEKNRVFFEPDGGIYLHKSKKDKPFRRDL